MKPLSEVQRYLIQHWRTYEQMELVEEEINKYLESLAPRIKSELREAAGFPKDWDVDWFKDSDETIYVRSLPKSWKVAGRLPDSAYVDFGGLEASQLLAHEREDRAWVALVSEYDRRKRFPKRLKWCRELRELCREPDMLTGEFEYTEDSREYVGAILFQFVEPPLPLRIMEDDDVLVKTVIEKILPLVRYVEKLRKAHPKLR